MGARRGGDEQDKLLASDELQREQQQQRSRPESDAVATNADEEADLATSQYGRNLSLEQRGQQTSIKGQVRGERVEVGALRSNNKWLREQQFKSIGGHRNDDDDDEDDEDERERSGSSEEDRNNRTSEGQTMMHILKANIGTGVLAMPLAFKHVGLWLGLVLVPLIGAICIHCMNILIASGNKLCDRFNYESLDYDQVAALALACGPKWTRRLAKRASFIVTLFLMLTQIGFCCVYILFTVENLQVACLNLFGLDYSLITYLLATFPIIWLTSCTSNLKHLARISTLANCLQLFGLALIMFDLLQFHTYSRAEQAAAGPVYVEQGVAADIRAGAPIFFAMAVYAFEGIGVVLPLVKEMEEPRKISGLNGVLNTAMSWVALLYMAMGFFGYAKYGQTVASSITLNLPESTLNELVRLAFALAIGLSYSLQFYVPWTIVWPVIDEALFYAYRPRKPRNKLQILSKLSAENQWAIESLLQPSGTNTPRARDHHAPTGGDQSEQQANQLASQLASQLEPQTHLLTGNSLATTFATSYSISVSTKLHPPTGAHSRRRLNPSQLQMHLQQQQQQQHYGSLHADQTKTATTTTTTTTSRRLSEELREKRPRNRMDDLLDEDQSDSEMPDVQWRPPPRSMRGKRKLVRYTIILLTVSFTFVAAALIPRLDLFISLIGALASSCLAIIFPAIIQLCTFWNQLEEDANENHDDEDEDEAAEARREESHKQQQQQQQHEEEALCLCASTRQAELSNCRHCWSVRKRRGRRQRQLRKRLLWHLFAAKNLFLVLFGFVGLITGTWVSLRQLGVASV